jgi:acetolactate synthase-1/2/3 large subunit
MGMANSAQPASGADALIRQLRDHGVRYIFGYPGGQLTPIYDALAREPNIRHILARDEQAAAFMADGYARATGQPGVCLAVCGPGVFNALTPLATAFTDSVPILLISGQIATPGKGLRSGYYHENDQFRAVETATKLRVCVQDVKDIVPELGRAFSALTHQRPGPVMFEIPVDVQRAPWGEAPFPTPPTVLVPLAPRPHDLKAVADLVSCWAKPLILAGGGVITAGASSYLVQLAERLGAPVFYTAMGKGAMPEDHPLSAGLPWLSATSDLSNMASMFSPLFQEADGLLAVGCRFTQLATGSWTMPLPPSLAQIDIDPAEIGRHYRVAVGIHADAALTLRGLIGTLPVARRQPWFKALPPRPSWRLPGFDVLGPLRRALPRDAIIAADITRLAYMMLAEFPIYQPRTFLHPAGFVSMGYGLPAALGAKAAFPERTVVAIAGDGCFLMSALELATAVQERLAVVVILINDNCLSLIKAIQERRYEGRYLGVDLLNPDFAKLADAFGVRYWQPNSEAAFEAAVREAVVLEAPALIEVKLGKS